MNTNQFHRPKITLTTTQALHTHSMTWWQISRILLGLIVLAVPLVARAQFNYVTQNGAIIITGYAGPGGLVTIPSNINGLPVTGIGHDAFYGLTSLTNVTIPSSVTSIGLFAFSRCVSLTNVTIPSSVTSMGDFAFSSCRSLTKVSIPSGVTSIEGGLFDGCYALSEVAIGGSVTNIGNYAFNECLRLTSVILPSTVASIGNYAFQFCTNLTSMIIPSNASSIGNSAFRSCYGLTGVTMPNSITWIGVDAFSGCSRLTAVFFAGNAPALGPVGAGDVSLGSFATVYYLPGATGWADTYGGLPAKLWNPVAQTSDPSFGVRGNRFGFDITGTPEIPIVVEACTNLATANWVPLQSLKLTNGLVYFNDATRTNSPARFYRITSP